MTAKKKTTKSKSQKKPPAKAKKAKAVKAFHELFFSFHALVQGESEQLSGVLSFAFHLAFNLPDFFFVPQAVSFNESFFFHYPALVPELFRRFKRFPVFLGVLLGHNLYLLISQVSTSRIGSGTGRPGAL